VKNDLSNANIKVKVFGVDEIINVEVKKTNDDEWEGIVKMPKALEIKDVVFLDGKTLPVVFYSRIAHIIIQDDGSITPIHDKEGAELTIKKYCDFLKVPALGMMYFNSKDFNLVPLVYVKSVDTLFWENSCASGTTAVGEWIFSNNNENNIGKSLKIDVIQPSKAVLTIYNDDNGSIYLKGNVRIDA
jgi:diaminopimelate epimerase